jgi:uncharacterized repeat protein (TIGR01451 family)
VRDRNVGGESKAWRRLPTVLAFWLAAGGALPAAAQTRPGTVVTNTAAVAFTLDGEDRRVDSNSVTLTIAERLDIVLAPGGTTPVLTPPYIALGLVLTNGGTGSEAFVVSATPTVAGVTVTGIAIDVDGNGSFDPAVDTLLAGATPPVAPGEALHLLVLVSPVPDAEPTGGAVTVTASAATAAGTPADAIAGAGDDGSEAVIGTTGATAAITLPFAAPTPPASALGSAPTLAKTQSVRAPDGSARPVAGAVVTYTLVASFPDATEGARIDDPIPAGTRYVPGSLTLDDAVLTDAVGDDAGELAGAGIAVTLGDVPAAAVRTVRFQVRLP